MEDAHEADDEEDDGAHVLQNHRRVGHQRPEVVGLEPRVSLQVLEKRSLIGIVVRI